MEIRGAGGVLRAGYQRAASLGRWTLTRRGSDYDLLAELVEPDAFWITSRPLTLRLALPNRHWVWRIEDVLITATALTVVLTGPPDIR